jgi:hypothetical protein
MQYIFLSFLGYKRLIEAEMKEVPIRIIGRTGLSTIPIMNHEALDLVPEGHRAIVAVRRHMVGIHQVPSGHQYGIVVGHEPILDDFYSKPIAALLKKPLAE